MVNNFLLFFCILNYVHGAYVTVLQTSESVSKFEPYAGAELLNTSLFGQNDVTICTRFFTYQFTTHKYDKPYQNILVLKKQYLLYSKWVIKNTIVGRAWIEYSHNFGVWDLGVWNHVCVMLNSDNGTVRTVLNEKTIINMNDYGGMHSKENTNVFIMGDPSATGFVHSLFGRIADVNIWSHGFTEDEARAWTRCELNEEGDILDWRTATWRAKGLQEVKVDREEVGHQKEVKALKVSSIRRNFDDPVHFASALGGEMAVADSNATAKSMMEVFSTSSLEDDCKHSFYTGFTDGQEEGRFVNINTGKGLTWNNWAKGEPNNFDPNNIEQGEDCTQIKTHGLKQLNDISCSEKYCSILKLEDHPKFQMRGVCKESDVDTYYVMLLDEDIKMRKELIGFKQTKMMWSLENTRWNIINLVNGHVLAHTNSTLDYPIGTHRWFFSASSPCTDPGQPWRQLNLQQKSQQPGQFCCDDGICIDSDQRCDDNQHCRDMSDEKDCQMINIPHDSYNSENPPSLTEKRGKEIIVRPLEIDTSIHIHNIIEINEDASVISLMFSMSLRWTDKRLQYNFLKKDALQNTIKHTSAPIWIPSIIFLILRGQGNSIEIDRKITVERDRFATMSANIDSLHASETYTGNGNPLTMTVIYQGDFVCTFSEIAFYPFDRQTCSIEIYLSGTENNNTCPCLVPRMIQDSGPSSIGQYDVRGWRIKAGILKEGREGLTVTVDLDRNLASILLVTYLPTILINLINQATNYSEDNYELVVTVNITCMIGSDMKMS